jgi:hypothetical protein
MSVPSLERGNLRRGDLSFGTGKKLARRTSGGPFLLQMKCVVSGNWHHGKIKIRKTEPEALRLLASFAKILRKRPGKYAVVLLT